MYIYFSFTNTKLISFLVDIQVWWRKWKIIKETYIHTSMNENMKTATTTIKKKFFSSIWKQRKKLWLNVSIKLIENYHFYFFFFISWRILLMPWDLYICMGHFTIGSISHLVFVFISHTAKNDDDDLKQLSYFTIIFVTSFFFCLLKFCFDLLLPPHLSSFVLFQLKWNDEFQTKK